jgi:hypothetical protein
MSVFLMNNLFYQCRATHVLQASRVTSSSPPIHIGKARPIPTGVGHAPLNDHGKINKRRDKMEQMCATCKFAQGFAFGPGISGPEEGVKCTNSEFARYLDELQKGTSYQQEFNEHGFINIFRVEAVASHKGEECQFWEAQDRK